MSELAAELSKTGLCISPHFLSRDELKLIQDDFRSILLAGRFKPAGVGLGPQHTVNTRVRGDATFWLDRAQAGHAQKILWAKLDVLQQELNRSLFLNLRSFAGHYAAYPVGGFYQRHRDAFANNLDRMVSLILYLNSDWQPSDGGQLRVYAEGGYTDVDPIGGTLVCFMSRELEHEVLQSHKERMSFTGWFKV